MSGNEAGITGTEVDNGTGYLFAAGIAAQRRVFNAVERFQHCLKKMKGYADPGGVDHTIPPANSRNHRAYHRIHARETPNHLPFSADSQAGAQRKRNCCRADRFQRENTPCPWMVR